MSPRFSVAAALLAGALLAAPQPLAAEINLDYRPVDESCAARDLLVDLYAVSDDETDQPLAAMDVILAWDPADLRLLGTGDHGPYPYNWLFSGFAGDHGLDGLNDTWTDGNALYTALAQLSYPPQPAYATPEGLLVATFRFQKLRVGEPTEIAMLSEFGSYSQTAVYDGTVPGLAVTGTLDVEVLVPDPAGDSNCSGTVDFGDINPFVLALSNPQAWMQQYPCDYVARNDLNCDGQINFADINPFVARLTGGPP